MQNIIGSIQAKSPHAIRSPAGIGDKVRFTAYPGWRWRLDEDGSAYHELIPNPIIRWWDRLTRRAQR